MTIPTAPWLLLIHRLPTRPAYLRVKVGRRLQQIGAAAVKSTVYALPNTEATREALQWLLRELVADGGEGIIWEAEVVEGMSGDELRELFREARRLDYEEIAAAALEALPAPGSVEASPDADPVRQQRRLARLRQRIDRVAEIDFFEAAGRDAAEAALRRLAEAVLPPPPEEEGIVPANTDLGELRNRTWVTRKGVAVDRIACAWLIRRFIDPAARFRFEERPSRSPASDEIHFDTYGGHFSHEGDRCSFEVMLERCDVRDPGLAAIGEIVHDIDLRDEKFARPETPGVARLIHGIRDVEADDEARIERGALVFDVLFAGLRSSSTATDSARR